MVPRQRMRAVAATLTAMIVTGLVASTAFLAARPLAAQEAPEACRVTVAKSASPTSLELGEEVTVTLTVSGSCPERPQPTDVMLAIDRSTSMVSNNKLRAAKDAAIGFVDSMDPAVVHVGLVAFSSTPDLVVPLTDDQNALRSAIDGLSSELGTNLVDSLEMARSELVGPSARADASHVIVFLTDGRHRSGPDISTIDTVLDAVRAAGIETYAIALGSDADHALLRRIATDSDHYFDSPDATELAAIYEKIARRIKAPALLKSARIVDRIPGNMSYVAGFADPVEPTISPDGKLLTWDLAHVPEPGMSVSYRLEPLEAGTHPTNVEAWLEYTDGFDDTGRLPFEVPTVTVKAPAKLCVCRIIYLPWRVRADERAAILARAFADPSSYYGWNLLTDPGKPGAPPYPQPGYDAPPNPRRTCLDLRKPNVPYHWMFNSPVWRSGCLSGPAVIQDG